MMPSDEGLKKWLLSMQALKTLANLASGSDVHLLPGIVLSALQNPLLRTITINEAQHIAATRAYIGPSGCMFKFADNPLENTAPKDACRVRMEFGIDDIILIEQNVGPRKKDHIERELDRACETAGNAMTASGDFLGPAGQQFSRLLHMTTKSHGGNFEWREVARHNVSEFKTITIVDNAKEKAWGVPTFTLILTF